MRSLLAPTTALALARMAVASEFIGMGSGSHVTLPEGVFEGAMSKPNATGRFTIDGFDITKPYPLIENGVSSAGLVPMEEDAGGGWSLDVNITADIPAKGIRLEEAEEDEYISGVTIKLNVPESLVETEKGGNSTIDVDESWNVCVTYLAMAEDSLSQETKDGRKTDDGTCRDTLGDECRDAILTEWSNISTENGDCVLRDLPEACRSRFGEDTRRANGGVTTIPFNRTNFADSHILEFSSSAAELHKLGDKTAYDTLGQAIPVILTWGYSSREALGDMWHSPRVSLACVRPDKAANDQSEVPNAGFTRDTEGGEQQPGSGENNEGDQNDNTGDDNKNAGGKVSTGYWAAVAAVAVGVVFTMF